MPLSQKPDSGTPDFRGRVALVSGASRGIGRAVALEMAACGAHVLLAARNSDALKSVSDAITRKGGVATVCVMDVACNDSVGAIIGQSDPIDILVNCAAGPLVEADTTLASLSAEALTEDFDIKYGGYLRLAQAVAGPMAATGWGRIVNIGGFTQRDATGISGFRNAAVTHLTRYLALQLGPSGITVNAVHPGLTLTEYYEDLIASRAVRENRTYDEIMQDMASCISIGRLPRAEEVARVVTQLCAPWAAIINGESIAVDGGMSAFVRY